MAHHEAGHAVAEMIERGRPPVVVSITPDPKGGSLGHSHSRRWRKDFELWNDYGVDRWWKLRRRLEPHIVIALAGVFAERRHTGRRHNWAGAAHDIQNALQLALQLEGGGEPASRYVRWLEARTERLVELNWSRIEWLAKALLERRTLRNREVWDAQFDPADRERIARVVQG